MELDIKKVVLIENHKPDKKGVVVPVANPHFRVYTKDGEDFNVPFDPTNRHYWEVRDWYVAQKKKPFKFDFMLHPDDLENQDLLDNL